MRAIALASLLSIGVLAGCAGNSFDVVAGVDGTGLPGIVGGNLVPVAGARHVTLDARGDELVEGVVRAALLNPGDAVFTMPFYGAETGTRVLVCGTVSARVGGVRSDEVPFAVSVDYGLMTSTGPVPANVATLERLGGSVGFQGPYSVANDDVVTYCRERAGIIP